MYTLQDRAAVRSNPSHLKIFSCILTIWNDIIDLQNNGRLIEVRASSLELTFFFPRSL